MSAENHGTSNDKNDQLLISVGAGLKDDPQGNIEELVKRFDAADTRRTWRFEVTPDEMNLLVGRFNQALRKLSETGEGMNEVITFFYMLGETHTFNYDTQLKRIQKIVSAYLHGKEGSLALDSKELATVSTVMQAFLIDMWNTVILTSAIYISLFMNQLNGALERIISNRQISALTENVRFLSAELTALKKQFHSLTVASTDEQASSMSSPTFWPMIPTPRNG